ncbi:MAG: penicillin acylase family protein [Deltaproteobacteria bacterium]|nr:penicillin acylase family protein [Deltaproteobacteria bacterium]
MTPPARWMLLGALGAALTGCPDAPSTPDATVTDSAAADSAPPPDAAPRNILETVPAMETWEIPGLRAEAHVLRTAAGVPHIYAADREDLSRLHGFVIARDRFFFLDLTRRFAQSRLSELLGSAALDTDLNNRGVGMNHVTGLIADGLSEEQGRWLDAYAEGINAYIDQVRERALPPPSEYVLAAPLLGRARPADLMTPFNRRDVAAMLATVVYNLGFETDDPGRALAAERLPGRWDGVALAELRRAGTVGDIWERITPLRPTASANGWGTETGLMTMALGGRPGREPDAFARWRPSNGVQNRSPSRHSVPALERLTDNLRVLQESLRRTEGFGSNAWAVGARGTPDMGGILAGDGHLPLSIPSLFYQIGFDTKVLGGTDFEQVGLTIPGIPFLAVGTNGRVAWCQTQLAGDISDWYREELVLDATGAPMATRFRGETRPLQRVTETFMVADLPALMSRGRTETRTRYVTFDGRWITEVEGRRVLPTDPVVPGQARVMTLRNEVVPGDTNSDGVVTAYSFDHPILDGGNLLQALDRFGRARDVGQFREATRGLVGYSQNIVAADARGGVLYTSYQTVPCRTYLERTMTGAWGPGSDPTRLLDGTRYGGFRIPLRDGVVDEAPGRMDPYQCVVPFDRTPTALDPTRGYVFTANNDPGGATFDNSVTNDPFYVGGPWNDGYRAYRIDELLRGATEARQADVARMASVQADVRSPLGGQFASGLLDAIDRARAASLGTPTAGSAEARLAERYRANAMDFDEVARRVRAWVMAGPDARSGVDTFYHTADAEERTSAVATMLFNAWVGRFVRAVFDDEPLPDGVWSNGGSPGRVRTLALMLDGRGPMNATRLASWNPATHESAFFDVVGTEAVETSHEVALLALERALVFLRSPPTGPGAGGFGTREWDQLLWGHRHHMRFESILRSFLGDNMQLRPLVEGFSITPRLLPLAEGLGAMDPRATLPGFPRPGDQWVVDAANSGLSGESFTYGSGPNFRMVIQLREGMPMRGQNVLPGGQSGLTTSPNYSDQARLWLGNRALPIQLEGPAVVAAAVSRERFLPARR